jgi:drug/metabolite transporter (DMT)-like permease
MSLGSVVIVVVAVALLVTVALLIRSRAHPWSTIVVAMFTCGVCFTVGGGSGEDDAGPSVATVVAAIVGLLSVAAAVIALIPRSSEVPPSRFPRILASAGIVIGALGLVLNELVS